MDLRPLWLVGSLGVTGLPGMGGTPAPEAPAAAPAEALADPFLLPPDALIFVRRVGTAGLSDRFRLQNLVRNIFAPRETGGMAIQYDNARTRSVADVWLEGKANCLSLTAFFVASCKALNISVDYAEVLNTNHWRRVGNVVHFERHVVAMIRGGSSQPMVADFVPDLRKSIGTYVVSVIPEARFRAFYYSNLAVEAYTRGDLEEARQLAQVALAKDPKSGVGWNILGVVQSAQGDLAGAEASYRKAMALDPKDGSPIGNMEALTTLQGRTEEAAKFRQMGEKTRKLDPYFHAYLAEEALGDGHLLEASGQIHEALKLLPTEPDFFLLDARVKLASGDSGGAVKELERAKALSDPRERERYDSKIYAIRGLKPAVQN